MKRTRHQLTPAVSVQEIIDRAVAGRVPDCFLVGRLEIMDVQHLAGPGRFGKAREQGLFFGQRHVLVLASAIRLGLERVNAALVIGHVRAVHRAQRHAHRSRNRRLRHPALTQQHHLDALALRGRYLPSQRSFQPPHLGFAAFDHLFPPNQMAQANHTSGRKTVAKLPDSSRYGGGISGVDQSCSSRGRRARFARKWFADNGPPDIQPLPLGYDEREALKGGGAPHILAWYARSLAGRKYNVLEHPLFDDYARGVMASEYAPGFITKNDELRQ